MLTPANKAMLCSFASEKMAYKRVKEHISTWCATKLHIPQELTRTICIPLEPPDSSRASQLILAATAKDGRDERPGSISNLLRKGGAPYTVLHLFLFLQALPAPAKSVVALLHSALELALPSQQWSSGGDVPLVGCLEGSL